ncbi:co-chaperone GroES [Candidatus Peribacteria bacterium]|nr:co-chaperone GroES [Candidatus Peribacteria bacterium]
MTSLQPLGDNLLVRPVTAETKTSSGIIIPDTASKEKPMKGIVVALSSTPIDQAQTLQQLREGDTVYFTKYAPTELKINGEELYILDAKSVLAKEV